MYLSFAVRVSGANDFANRLRRLGAETFDYGYINSLRANVLIVCSTSERSERQRELRAQALRRELTVRAPHRRRDR